MDPALERTWNELTDHIGHLEDALVHGRAALCPGGDVFASTAPGRDFMAHLWGRHGVLHGFAHAAGAHTP